MGNRNIKGKKVDPVLDIPKNFREERELIHLKQSDDVDRLREVLGKDEKVYRLVVCYHQKSDGVLVLTNKRIIFCDQRFIRSKIIVLEYDAIAALLFSVEGSFMEMSIVGLNDFLTLSQIDKKHGERLIRFAEKMIGQRYRISKNGRSFKYINDILTMDKGL